MLTIETSIVVNQPVEKVFAVVSNHLQRRGKPSHCGTRNLYAR
jgi:hypothetical protein